MIEYTITAKRGENKAMALARELAEEFDHRRPDRRTAYGKAFHEAAAKAIELERLVSFYDGFPK